MRWPIRSAAKSTAGTMPDTGRFSARPAPSLALTPLFIGPAPISLKASSAWNQGSATTEQGRQVIDKIRKLLALGGSDNEHEAALAVQRAGELLTRYRLDFDALVEDEGLAHRSIATCGRTLPVHRKSICAILESCFAVRVICASLYDPLADRSYKTIELLGREEEVAIAEHCYHFLENRLQTLWEQNRRGFTGNGRIAKKSYYLGLLAGFRETLERSLDRSTKNFSTSCPAHRSAGTQGTAAAE